MGCTKSVIVKKPAENAQRPLLGVGAVDSIEDTPQQEPTAVPAPDAPTETIEKGTEFVSPNVEEPIAEPAPDAPTDTIEKEAAFASPIVEEPIAEPAPDAPTDTIEKEAQNNKQEEKTSLEKISWTELGVRVVKFLILTAMAATADVSFDIYAAVIYFQGSLMIFGAFAVVIICVSPTCVWLFLYTNNANPGPLWKYFTTVEIWEKAWGSVKSGKPSFDLAFVALGEACLEAFPTSILQQFSVMSKMVGVEGTTYYLLRGSMVSSLLLMSKSLVGFDFYGSKSHTWAEYLLQGCFRVGETGARTLSISHFWLLLRPTTEISHGFTAYHMPPLILISLLANIILLRRYLSNLPLSQVVIWATLLMLASPPKFLAGWNQVRLGFWVYRALEFIVMIVLVFTFGNSPMQRIRENTFFAYVLAACVLLIVISYAAQKVFLRSASQEYQVLSATEQGEKSDENLGPLNSAVLENDVPLANLFIRLSGDLNEPDFRGNIPLSFVRSPEMLQVLLAAGAQLDTEHVPGALVDASRRGNLFLIEKFMEDKIPFPGSITDGVVKELAGKCKSMNLTNAILPDAVMDISYKELVKNMQDFTTLDLRGKKFVGDEIVEELARTCKGLNLTNTTLPDTVTDIGYKELAKNCPPDLSEINLSDKGQIGDETVQELARNCKGLNLTNTTLPETVTDIGYKELVKNMQDFTVLDLNGKSFVGDEIVKEIATNCPQLQTIDLSMTKVTDQGVQELAHNCKGLNLTNTTLPDTVTDIGYKELTKNLPPDLSEIDLSGKEQIGDETVQELGRHCKGLNLTNTRLPATITAAGYKELANNTTPALTDVHVKEIARNCPNLDRIDLRNRPVTDAGVQEIAQHCHNLQEIYLSSTQVTDAGVQEIATHCPQLHTIYLTETKVTDQGVQDIAAHCPQLTTIGLNGTNVTDAGIQELAEKIPGEFLLYLPDDHPAYKARSDWKKKHPKMTIK